MNIQLVSSTGNTCEKKSGDITPPEVFPRDNLKFRETVLGALEQLLPDLIDIQTDQSALVFVRGDPHEGRVFVVSHEWQIDGSGVLFDFSADEGFVFAGDLSGAEEGVHAAEGGVGASEDDEAGGVHSEAVDYHFVHAVGFGAVAFENGLVEGGIGGVFAGNGEDTGGFVDDDDVFVFENDVEVIFRDGPRTLVLSPQFLKRRILLGLDVGGGHCAV
mmetsp:Transcript_25754/g.54181  ORF Transcript_25754/g.54181 Transcript_25754/m.54181 type:complete len:217 (-) Transcript_25754:341-991(-)